MAFLDEQLFNILTTNTSKNNFNQFINLLTTMLEIEAEELQEDWFQKELKSLIKLDTIIILMDKRKQTNIIISFIIYRLGLDNNKIDLLLSDNFEFEEFVSYLEFK